MNVKAKILPAFLAWMLSVGSAAYAEGFLPIEVKWLNAVEPVLNFAAEQGLPVDVAVLARHSSRDVSLSMSAKEGRCQLTLSLRDNPEAEATLAKVPAERHALMIEVMAAHELAHCWRYKVGKWHALPAGFNETPLVDDNADRVAKLRQIRATRREEGFADLVALAWTLERHPKHYASVHAWMRTLRDDQDLVHGPHDTRAWLELARDEYRFAIERPLFEQAQVIWAEGLRLEEGKVASR